ncbi:MAG: nucleotidyl transferase AbiEii/AbiGii toxin family protein [Gemmatimonadaceae bacterium]
MIRKEEILERARAWQLRPEVVEKDYVLGWLLAAVSRHQETATTWVLKGGTCIKKCFLETYRFSEDLDFSLLPDAEYSLDGLRTTLLELAGIAGELSGVEFNEAEISVRARVDKLGRETFEGKIGYRGPLQAPNWPRILFDLTAHEPVVDEPTQRSILHDYPDALGDDAEEPPAHSRRRGA